MKKDLTLIASYSEAFFAATRNAGVLDEVNNQVTEFKSFVEKDRRMVAFMEAPNIPRESKEEVFTKVFGNRYHPILLNFLKLLIRRGRLELFFSVLTGFQERYRTHLGITSASITSAVELDAATREKLTQSLNKYTGKTLVIDWKQDPAVIGGIKFLCGDLLIDNTVKTGLDRLRHDLLAARVV